jgi:predicted deacylase
MKNSKFTICDTAVNPGEIANLALPLPQQYSCSPLFMPIKVINGVKSGPCMVIFSVLKGTELNGVEIANRISTLIKPEELSGTIITIPVVNVYGLTHYPSMLPNGKNLADCFPGDEQGTFGERIAYLFTHEILKKANYCIELQTGEINHNILPQIYCNFDNVKAKELAKVFKTPVITDVTVKGNLLRQTTEELQVPLLVYEAGEALRLDQNSIALGVEGIKMSCMQPIC